MAVDPENVDLTHIEDVSDIEPPPILAVSENQHRFGPIGYEGKRLLKELLQATDESTPFEDRVFNRLGLSYQHATWDKYDLYWVDEGSDAFVEALENWNAARGG